MKCQWCCVWSAVVVSLSLSMASCSSDLRTQVTDTSADDDSYNVDSDDSMDDSYAESEEAIEVGMGEVGMGEVGMSGASGSTFRDFGFNPPVDPSVDPLSTFALDVDTASYAVSRNFLNNRQLPPSEAVRVEEFVNYFDGGYLQRMAQGQDTGVFLISLDATSQRFSSRGRVLLRVGVQAPTEFAEMVVPDSVVLVVDRSGSMDSPAGGSESLPRYRLVHQAVDLLIEGLSGNTDTRLGLVAYSDNAATIFDPVVVSENTEWIMRRVRETINPTNSTNVEDGLKLGYEMALSEAQSGRNVLVLLLSDGVANVGATSSRRILDEIGRRADIGLSTIGVGLGTFNDELMEQLANSADGTYHYIDTPDEARRIFVDNLTSLLTEAARDARIQVEFNPESVDSYRLLGFENRAIPDEDFRDDTREAGKVGAGQSSTAIYELELKDTTETAVPIAEVTLRYIKPRSERVTEQTRSITVGEVGSSFGSADARFRLAVVAAQFAELLRGSPYIGDFDMFKLIEAAGSISSELDNDSDAVELYRLIKTAKDLGLTPPNPVSAETTPTAPADVEESVDDGVTVLSRFVAIAAGDAHSCGIRTDQMAICWGNMKDYSSSIIPAIPFEGQDIDMRSEPYYEQAYAPEGRFTAISAGWWNHSCGIREDQTAVCWGNNDDGQTDVPEGRFTAISAGGDHSCGISTDRKAVCWGAYYNANADMSNDFTALSDSEGNEGFGGAAAAGSLGIPAHAHLRLPADQMSSRRIGNAGYELGTDFIDPPDVPQGRFGQFVAITSGYDYSCGIRTDQTATCWGGEDYGYRWKVDVPEGRFTAISAGREHTCGIREDQTAVCWGNNDDGQTDVPEGRFTAISAGGWHTCGIREDQTAVCWGYNYSGQTDVPEGRFMAISAGGGYTCGIREDQTAICWGYNLYGQTDAP